MLPSEWVSWTWTESESIPSASAWEVYMLLQLILQNKSYNT
ncbi:hypothetical protein NY78_4457 [Desulfovibrio sp. TomC]|nr:hypothetical protein NY78_4457 [Desulfovibrio sp. TomC]